MLELVCDQWDSGGRLTVLVGCCQMLLHPRDCFPDSRATGSSSTMSNRPRRWLRPIMIGIGHLRPWWLLCTHSDRNFSDIRGNSAVL